MTLCESVCVSLSACLLFCLLFCLQPAAEQCRRHLTLDRTCTSASAITSIISQGPLLPLTYEGKGIAKLTKAVFTSRQWPNSGGNTERRAVEDSGAAARFAGKTA